MMKTKYIITIMLFAIILSACEKTDLSYPVALFKLDSKPRPLYKYTLDASASFSEIEDDFLEYRWDLNGDHLEWETDWMPTPRLTATSQSEYSWIVGLQVRNSAGNVSELYRQIYPLTSGSGYYIFSSYTDITPDFRAIRYSEYTEEYHYTIYWAYDNILQASGEGVYNFDDSYTQAKYGSLMCWDSAMSLNDQYKLPTLEQWNYMINFSGGMALAGYNLQVEVEHGLNLTCSGIKSNGYLVEVEENGYYWTGEEATESSAWAIKISKDQDEVEFVELDKSSMASVRVMFENYQYYD